MSSSGQDLLHVAAVRGDVDRIREILDEHPTWVDAPRPSGETALLLAVKNAHLNAAHVLLAYGADPEAQDNHGDTPWQNIHSAVAANRKYFYELRALTVERLPQFAARSVASYSSMSNLKEQLVRNVCARDELGKLLDILAAPLKKIDRITIDPLAELDSVTYALKYERFIHEVLGLMQGCEFPRDCFAVQYPQDFAEHLALQCKVLDKYLHMGCFHQLFKACLVWKAKTDVFSHGLKAIEDRPQPLISPVPIAEAGTRKALSSVERSPSPAETQPPTPGLAINDLSPLGTVSGLSIYSEMGSPFSEAPLLSAPMVPSKPSGM